MLNGTKAYIKSDNRIENLEWCNRSENQIHAYEHNLQPKNHLGKFSKNHVASKPIELYDINMNYIRYFHSVTETASYLKCNTGRISLCANGKIDSINNHIVKYKQK